MNLHNLNPFHHEEITPSAPVVTSEQDAFNVAADAGIDALNALPTQLPGLKPLETSPSVNPETAEAISVDTAIKVGSQVLEVSNSTPAEVFPISVEAQAATPTTVELQTTPVLEAEKPFVAASAIEEPWTDTDHQLAEAASFGLPVEQKAQEDEFDTDFKVIDKTVEAPTLVDSVEIKSDN